MARTQRPSRSIFPNMVDGVKAVLYARVSSKEQEQEGYSIPAQLNLLRGYARDKSIRIAKEFVDVETAKAAGRSKFTQMAGFLRDHPDVQIILCEKTDRLYRNFKDYVTIDDLDIEIHLVKEGEILSRESKSHQKLTHGIKLLMAKNYIDNLSEETRKGMLAKAEQGIYPSCAPLGYLNIRDGKRSTIDIDPTVAPVIRKMFESYASGNYSLEAIRQMATGAGLRSRRGKKLCISRVESILKNLFYMGQFRWRDKIYAGGHPRIVTPDLFEKVQTVFAGRRHPALPTKRRFAYTGMIRCAKCGCLVTAEIKDDKYIYYHCTGGKGYCGRPYVREEKLEVLLGELVLEIQIDMETAEWIKRALIESHGDETKYHDDRIAELNRQYGVIQSRLDRVYDDMLEGKVDEVFWKRRSEEWRAEQREIRRALEDHERANQVYLDEGIKIIELAQRAYSLWLSRDSYEKRKILDALLSNCTFDGVRLMPTYRKPFCWLANRPAHTVCLPQQD